MCEYMVYTKMYVSVESVPTAITARFSHSDKLCTHTTLSHDATQLQLMKLPKKSCSGLLCPGFGFCAVLCTLA